MARAKPSRDPVLQSWQQVDNSMRRIGEITATLDKANADLNKRIQTIRESVERTYADLAREKLRLEKDIEEFTCSRRDEFKEKKSKPLTFGIVSFRIVRKLLVKSNAFTVEAIKRILGLNALKYLHVQEKPNKETLAELEDQELRNLGVIRKITDDFGYKLNWQNLQEVLAEKAETAAGKK